MLNRNGKIIERHETNSECENSHPAWANNRYPADSSAAAKKLRRDATTAGKEKDHPAAALNFYGLQFGTQQKKWTLFRASSSVLNSDNKKVPGLLS